MAHALQRRRVLEQCGTMGLGARALLDTPPPESHLTGCGCGGGVGGECDADLLPYI
uniref:Uncharacterized protein n=1 Tax=Oryza sativa subsp. japonica TaxID=39947 RepID=Q69J02_ORYSJ|nr:hypothetical protein [Oryza sativa Japonica Group]BAD34400.1 hypothetical protein [Oryza sativa Japonica Group]